MSVRGKLQSLYQLLSNRRRFDRQPIQGAMALNCRNKYGDHVTTICSCTDISARGLGVQSPEPVIPNADAYITCEAHGLKGFAYIRYCVPRAGGHAVGLEFRSEPECWA